MCPNVFAESAINFAGSALIYLTFSGIWRGSTHAGSMADLLGYGQFGAGLQGVQRAAEIGDAVVGALAHKHMATAG